MTCMIDIFFLNDNKLSSNMDQISKHFNSSKKNSHDQMSIKRENICELR